MPPPKLFERTADELLADAQALAPVFTPEWTGAADPHDAGHALLVLSVRLIELLSERVNRVPEKNLLAFLDTVGVEQAQGMPAEAPVTFLLSNRAADGAQVPAGTQVATTQSETADAQVFETRHAFFATPAVLRQIIDVTPGGDSYAVLPTMTLPPTPATAADTSAAIDVLSPTSPSLLPVPHVLYLASATLFARKQPADIALVFAIASGGGAVFQPAHLRWERFDGQATQWVDIANVTYPAVSSASATVRFDAFPGSDGTTVGGDKDVWVRARLTTAPAGVAGLPVIAGITGSVATAAAPPAPADAALFNDTPLDLSKPVRPFGDRPRYGDAFHVGSAIAFGPGVASATLKVTLRLYTMAEMEAIFASITVNTTVTTTVEWQYLATGGVWKPLPAATVTHVLIATATSPPVITQSAATNVRALALFGPIGGATPTVDIPFTPPADMAAGKVGGVSARWVRAVLRSTDPYGRDAFVKVTGTVVTAVGPTFIPPIIEKVEIAYQYSTASVALDRVATSNNFEVVTRSSPVFGAGPLAPFVPLSAYVPTGVPGGGPAFLDATPGVYLGFDRSFGSAFISLLLAFVEPHDAAQLMPETGDPRVVWEYLGPAGRWRPLDVQDGTAALTSTGVVGFSAPSDATALTVFSELAGITPLFWYRARLQGGSFTTAPRLAAVVANTVMVDNQQTVRGDWVLASGSGEQHQRASILRRPVLAGDVWVREDELPNEAEIAEIVGDLTSRALDQGEPVVASRADAVSVRTAATGEPEVWVRWLAVPNFHVSGPRSRHHTLNPVSGEVTFGDGRGGLLTPIGKDNIVVRGLRSGGGEAANRLATPLAIKELKSSLPSVDTVFNLTGAVGGTDSWTFDQILDLGPQVIKNRGRAVSVEDYEWVTMAAFGQVARAKALATKMPAPGGVLVFKPGAVSIIVVPKGAERMPQPPRGLLRRIEAYLRQRAFGTILAEIFALPPVYTEVSVAATVHLVHPEERSVVERRVVQALETFFHPLTGGERREGWPFGRSVHISEVFAVIERVDGVGHVQAASFVAAPGASRFDVSENALVASGSHQIVMV